MAEEMKMDKGWGTLNTVLGVGALGSALGIGIPAITKAFSKDRYGYNRDGACSENTIVNRFELAQSQRISELESGKEVNQKLLDVYAAISKVNEKQDAKDTALEKQISELRCDTRVNEQAINDNLRFLDYKIDNNQKEMYAYVDCKTLPLEKKIPLDAICPRPLPGCVPVGFDGQVITTTPVDGSVSVVGNRRNAK